MNIFKREEKPNTPPIPQQRKNEVVDAVYEEGNDEEELETEEIRNEDNTEFKEEVKTKQPQKQFNPEEKAQLLLALEELVRGLCDIETQLKQQKIHWKSDKSMTGLMTLNELMTIASKLKYDIKNIGDKLMDDFDMTQEILNSKITEFASETKTYDFWLK